MSTQAPYFWIRKIEEQLCEHDRIPLFGNGPPFDWDRFSASLSARFGHPLQLELSSQAWKTAEDLKEGLGDEPILFPLKAGPLEGSAYWIMSREGVAQLAAWMMSGQAKTRSISSDILAEGFYRFLSLQILDSLSQTEPFHHLPLLISDTTSFPASDTFCIDIEIGFNKHTVWGRLAIEPNLQRSWAEYFSAQSERLPEKKAQLTELTVGIKVGSVSLTQQEWGKLKKGDFLLLDQGSYDPRKQTGSAYLTLDKMSLFTVKVKQNKIQLIDYSFIYEEEMPTPPHPEFTGPSEELPPATEEASALKDVPIHLTVELVRLRITLEKLMQLSPGNIIDLPLSPEEPVKLTINGQLVGHAELIHLGEALGLRILTLG